MSRSYDPGDDADAIIGRQVAKGNFSTPGAVVRAGVRMLEDYEAESHRSSGPEEMKDDIIRRGQARSRRKS